MLPVLGGLLLACAAARARAYHIPTTSSHAAKTKAAGGISRDAVLRRSGGAAAAAAAAASFLLRTPGTSRADDTEARPPAAAAAAPASGSKLYDRFFTDEIKNPGNAGFGSPTLLFLPPWMLGEVRKVEVVHLTRSTEAPNRHNGQSTKHATVTTMLTPFPTFTQQKHRQIVGLHHDVRRLQVPARCVCIHG